MAHRVVFVISGARSLSGGIAAVNANMLIALSEMVERGEIELAVHSLLERDSDRPPDLPASVRFKGYGDTTYRRSKLRFGADIIRFGLSGHWLLFERVGLARPSVPQSLTGTLRSIVFAHGRETWLDLTRLTAIVLRRARLVITNSEFTFERMQATPALTGRFRGVTCPLGMSPSFAIHATPPVDDGSTIALEASDGVSRELGDRVILLVGRLDPTEREKGQDRLISALPSVRRRFPEVQLVFPGGGDDRIRLARLAVAEGVADRVFFPGHVSNDALRRLYARCYAFAMPSRQEGFGLVYLEAMNFAKPCVGSRNDGAEDVIVHRETGFLVDDPNDIPALAATLEQLLADPAAAARMGRNGFDRLHREFTAEQFRSRFTARLREVLA